MTPEISYFIKVNIAFVLLYGLYRLFFYKDTFFVWRRFVLLSFFLISALYPFFNIQAWIIDQEPMLAMADLYASIMLPEISVNALSDPGTTMNWQNIFINSFYIIYITGVVLLTVRFFIQLICIIRLKLIGKRKEIRNDHIYELSNIDGPFSFFRWIFIPAGKDLTSDEVSEILTHEKTHAGQWHSIDVVISELFVIFCWLNPFIWLLKREIRNNLEFLADRKVLEAGYDCKSYQYHLLGHAYQAKATGYLYNSFNILPLKKRIMMMNKQRTKRIGAAKYLLFLPVAGVLMLISNIEVTAHALRNIDQDILTIPETDIVQSETVDFTPTEVTEDQVFEVVEQMPEYPGGTQALMQYLSRNIKYPARAIQNNAHGRVIAQFIVEKDGSIANAVIARSVDPDLDAEALRVVNDMPKWKPGMQRGQAVRTRYTIPVLFSLQAPEPVNENSYEVVEVMPEFPGGNEALMEYLLKNIKYPAEAVELGTQGRVIVQFLVDKYGKIYNPEVLRSVDPVLDQEAIRVVESMPDWKPGSHKGENVNVKFTVPIMFRLPVTESLN